jgi:chromosome partitioning protein
MAMVISVVNQKGGAGKTTTAINLAAALAEKKKKILLIDADHQSASASAILAPSEEHCALSAALNGDEIKTIRIGEKYDLIVSTLTLGETANSLSTIKTPTVRNKKLKTALEPIKNKYDYIIIDCPPNYNVITYNALWASDFSLIPMLANDLHYIALEDMLDIITSLQEQGAKVIPVGIIMIQYDKRLKLHNILTNKVEEEHPGLLFYSKIRNNIDIAEQATVNLDIFAYNSNCIGAKDYMDIANELERKIKEINKRK